MGGCLSPNRVASSKSIRVQDGLFMASPRSIPFPFKTQGFKSPSNPNHSNLNPQIQAEQTQVFLKMANSLGKKTPQKKSSKGKQQQKRRTPGSVAPWCTPPPRVSGQSNQVWAVPAATAALAATSSPSASKATACRRKNPALAGPPDPRRLRSPNGCLGLTRCVGLELEESDPPAKSQSLLVGEMEATASSPYRKVGKNLKCLMETNSEPMKRYYKLGNRMAGTTKNF